MTADQRPGPASIRGQIHDIGYRHYDGPRLGPAAIRRSLFVESLKGVFGLGRSARSKVMPFMLLVVITLPAVVLVIVTTYAGLAEIPGGYTPYVINLAIPITIFLGSQAPAIMSRDLRFRVVSLYFSRPLRRQDYVRAKYAAMTSAIFLLIVLPLTILFAGALLAELPWDEQLPDYLRSLAGAVLSALVLSGIGLTLAAMTPRRGLGVAIVVAVLLVLAGLQSAVEGLALEFDRDTLAGYAGLLSPFTLVDGVVSTALGGQSAGPAGPPDALAAWVFAAVLVVVIAGTYTALVARYRRSAAS